MNTPWRSPQRIRFRRSAFFRPQLEQLESRLVPDATPSSFSLATASLAPVPGDRGVIFGTLAASQPTTLALAGQALSVNGTIATLGVQNATAVVLVQFDSSGESAGFSTVQLGSSVPASPVLPGEGGGKPSTVSVVVTLATSREAPGVKFDGNPQVITVSPTQDRAPAARSQVEALAGTPLRSPPAAGDNIALPPAAPKTGGVTLVVSAAPAGVARPLPEAGPPPTTSQTAPVSLPGPTPLVENPGADSTVELGFDPPAAPSPSNSVQVSPTGPGPTTMSVSPWSFIESFPAGNEEASRSGGEKDAALAQTAARRKALALGLRYLYPDLTDDEIAQTAGVSRRTLFRWDEYMTLKRAQRAVHKRPRGYKDRQGNVEAWTEESE